MSTCSRLPQTPAFPGTGTGGGGGGGMAAAKFTEEFASGSLGDVLPAATWTPRVLNTTEYNNVVGAAIRVDGGVDLDAGNWYVSAWAAGNNAAAVNQRIRLTDGATELARGINWRDGNGASQNAPAVHMAYLTLAAQTAIYIEQYSTFGGGAGAQGAPLSDGGNEYYAELIAIPALTGIVPVAGAVAGFGGTSGGMGATPAGLQRFWAPFRVPTSLGASAAGFDDWIVPADCNILGVWVSVAAGQPASGDLTITLMVNGVDSAIQFVHGAGAGAAVYSDTVTSIALTAGDAIMWRAVNAAAGNSAAIVSSSIRFEEV